MEQLTLRVDENTKESLESEAAENSQSTSAYVRDLLRDRHEDDVDQDEVAELRERIDDLRDDREEKIRLEARVQLLEQEVDRLRDERDRLQARYHESQGKLKVHHSEKDGVLERVRDRFGL